MKTLTVRQPYASLLALGIKEFETRSKRTSVRGRIAIHAAAKPPVKVGDAALFGPYPVWSKPHATFMYTPIFGVIRLPLGAVLGTAVLDDIAPTDDPSKFTADEIAVGDFAPGRWAWHMSDAQLVQAVPAAGQLAWWEVDDTELVVVPPPVPFGITIPDKPAPPPSALSPVPGQMLAAIVDRHGFEHTGPMSVCLDPVCDAAERWTR